MDTGLLGRSLGPSLRKVFPVRATQKWTDVAFKVMSSVLPEALDHLLRKSIGTVLPIGVCMV